MLRVVWVQNVPNPVPRVEHPDWLLKRVAAASDKHRQQRLTSMFQPAKRGPGGPEKGADRQGGGSDVDIEDMDLLANASAAAARQGAKRRKTATLYRVRSSLHPAPTLRWHTPRGMCRSDHIQTGVVGWHWRC